MGTQTGQTVSLLPEYSNEKCNKTLIKSEEERTTRKSIVLTKFDLVLIAHLFSYAGISKSVDKGKAVAATMRSIKKLRKVSFFVISKWIQKDNIEVVVECVRKKTMKRRLRHWEEEEYDVKNSVVSDEVEVLAGEIFRLRIEGNIKEKYGNDSMYLTFKTARDNFHAITCSVKEESENYQAKVHIERGNKETEEIETLSSTESCCHCFSKKVTIKQTVLRETYSPYLNIPILVKDSNEELEVQRHKLYERQLMSLQEEKECARYPETSKELSSESKLKDKEGATTAELQLEVPDAKIIDSDITCEIELLANIKDSDSLYSHVDEVVKDGDSVTSELGAEKEALIEEQQEEKEKLMYNIPANVKLAKPVLFPSSIANLTKKITYIETELLALQLGMTAHKARDIRSSKNPTRELEHSMITNYRGTGTSMVKVKKLTKALKQINREDLADQVWYAMENDLPIPP